MRDCIVTYGKDTKERHGCLDGGHHEQGIPTFYYVNLQFPEHNFAQRISMRDN